MLKITKNIFLKLFSRLFRLSVFAWLAIMVIGLGLLFIFFFVSQKERWVTAEIRIIPESPYWLADTLRKGDLQYNNLGRKIAEVVDIQNYQWFEEKKMVYLTVSLKAGYNSRTKKLTFNYRPLEIGKPIELEVGNVGFMGVITDLDNEKDHWEWQERIVEVRVSLWSGIFPETLGLPSWRAEAIKVGDKMVDSQGRILAEVLEKNEKPAEKIVVTDDGRVLLREDPLKKDVVLRAKLRTIQREGVSYFLDDIKIKVGSNILLALPEIDILPEITKIIK